MAYYKLDLLQDLFIKADSLFFHATSEADLFASILLSGAVTGIVEPLLCEEGNKSEDIIVAELATKLSGQHVKTGEIRNIYNSAKHAGKNFKGLPKVKASDDLVIQINESQLYEEAKRFLFHAQNDIRKVTALQSANVKEPLRNILFEPARYL